MYAHTHIYVCACMHYIIMQDSIRYLTNRLHPPLQWSYSFPRPPHVLKEKVFSLFERGMFHKRDDCREFLFKQRRCTTFKREVPFLAN